MIRFEEERQIRVSGPANKIEYTQYEPEDLAREDSILFGCELSELAYVLFSRAARRLQKFDYTFLKDICTKYACSVFTSISYYQNWIGEDTLETWLGNLIDRVESLIYSDSKSKLNMVPNIITGVSQKGA